MLTSKALTLNTDIILSNFFLFASYASVILDHTSVQLQ